MNKIINTPQFLRWFGDWQSGKDCSQVVDKNGFSINCLSWNRK